MLNRIIHTSDTLLHALRALNDLSGGVMTLLVTDPDGRLRGTLTDGDVRRALIAGAPLHDSVTSAMHRGFRSLRDGDIDVEALARYRAEGLRLIPVIDADGHLTRLIDLSVTPTDLPLRAVVMAGGRGERLRPLTLTTPKPLLPIGGKAIIDRNIALLAAAGITDITVTTHYLAEQIEEHFAKPVEGVKVKTVRETKPLGTFGAVTLAEIPDDDGDTLIMNSDLLTDISLEQMWLRHKRTGADLTVATIPYTTAVPFAILTTEGDRVTALVEKPSYTRQANAGIYMVSNRLLHALPADTRIDATDFMEDSIAAGKKVGWHSIDGLWMDIGSPNDYRRASQLFLNQ